MLAPLLYGVTVTGAMFFAFWELKLKRELLDKYPPPVEGVSDIGVLGSISTQIKEECILENLPGQMLAKIRMIATVKFLLIAILVIEVLVLQR